MLALIYLFIISCHAKVDTQSSRILQLNINFMTYQPENRYLISNIIVDKSDERQDLIKSSADLTIFNQGKSDGTRFDVFEMEDDQLECYLSNVKQLGSMTCKTQNCSMTSKPQLNVHEYHRSIDGNHTIVTDNTRYPCTNGTFYPMIFLNSNLAIGYEVQATYFYTNKILIMLIICIGGIETMGIMVIYFKFRNIQKKLKKKYQNSLYQTKQTSSSYKMVSDTQRETFMDNVQFSRKSKI